MTDNRSAKTPSPRYARSRELLARALKTIPLGTQTFSKSTTHYPTGVSPHFAVRAKGSHLWDADGNEYVDLVSGLGAVTLGYNDPDVTAAVLAQLEDGVHFSLAHPIEIEVAEKIVQMVPCAEMVRFGKNGSDATTGAIRLARAATGRDHVLVCGYHGWHDWYIGSTARHQGVPDAVRGLTHNFVYNDLDSVVALYKQYPDQIAAVILEPMNLVMPAPGFLEGLRELTTRHGSVLIFDETITGFRYANGGAQEYFGVTPDLATFGKGVANGYPLSIVTGRADLMKLMEEVFFSFTFGGEALSLAAASATLSKLQREPVVATIRSRGEEIVAGINRLIAKHDVADVASTAGLPAWSFTVLKGKSPYTDYDFKTLFSQEMFAAGVLTLGAHNLCYAITDADIAQILGAYDSFFGVLKECIANESLHDRLQCEVLESLFKIR